MKDQRTLEPGQARTKAVGVRGAQDGREIPSFRRRPLLLLTLKSQSPGIPTPICFMAWPVHAHPSSGVEPS